MGVVRTITSVIRFKKPVFSRQKRRLLKAANIADLRLIAKRRLPGGIFDYFDGAADDEVTYRRNSSDFDRVEFRPRVLVDVSKIDTTASILGNTYDLPVILGPTGFTRIATSQGELAVVRAAERLNLPYTLSTLATRSIEEVGAASNATKWFQVYVWRDRGIVKSMLDRAREAGFSAIMLTVDTAILGRRERDVRRGFTLPPKIGLDTIIDGIRHPRWTWDFLTHEPITFANVASHADKDGGTAVSLSQYINDQMDPSVSWDDIAWLRANWNGPIIIKGIQRTEDAAVACEHGIDAISISNHGGRQLDHAPSPVSLLPEIADTVAGRCFVICDGGIRRGADVLKALALGANACSVGRAYLYGLGAAGEPGVDLAIGMLREEFRRAMALSGVRSLTEIDQSLVNWRKP